MKKWFKGIASLVSRVRKDISGSFRSPKPIMVISIAVLLIAVGQVMILIPFIPGLALTVPGLVLLSLYSPTIYKTLKQKLAGHPKIESVTDRVRNWLINRIRPRQ